MVDLAFKDLDEIALGDMHAPDAEQVIKVHLKNLDERVAWRIYTVLRSWVWKALNERRRDEDLRRWYNIIRATSIRFLDGDFVTPAYGLRALYELIDESITVSEKVDISSFFSRAHCVDIMIYILGMDNYRVSRRALLDKFRLKQPNLTRVMNMLLAANFVEKRAVGKSVYYRFTQEGLAEAERLKEANCSEGDSTVIDGRDVANLDEAYQRSVGSLAKTDDLTPSFGEADVAKYVTTPSPKPYRPVVDFSNSRAVENAGNQRAGQKREKVLVSKVYSSK